jgi:pyruvate dehydrogenase E2 component (dihydrolipoamide acetyltransferase)
VVLEVPSSVDGTLHELKIKMGDKVKAGTVFAEVEVSENAQANEEVDTGAKAEGKKSTEIEDTVEAEPVVESKPQAEVLKNTDSNTPTMAQGESINTTSPTIIPGGPAARRLARELGINIEDIVGSGSRGRISKKDVKNHAKQMLSGKSGKASATLPDLQKFGPVSRQPLSGIESATRDNMQQSWSEIPHAWLQEDINISELEAGRQRYKQRQASTKDSAQRNDTPLTVTAIIVKAVANCLKRFPRFNAALDNTRNELVLREYVNIGVAVDTPRGLLVPVLRQVDQMSIMEIAAALTEFGEKGRAGKLALNDLQGSGFTISNLGGIGVSNIFPVVNWPEVAILGLATSRMQPIISENKLGASTDNTPNISSGLIMPTTLGFDHRIINGADGARFLQYLKELLEDPMALSLL